MSQLSRYIKKLFVTVGYANADYIVDGTADNVQIQAALDAVNTAGGGRVLIKKGTYNVTSTLTIGSNTILEGEEKVSTIIKKTNSQNNTVITNKDTTNGNSYITIRNITIDQNGANQTGGGGCSVTGLFDSIFDNVIFNTSRVFNLFVGSLAGTSLTGTLTFTNGDATVTGSSTSFTTELAEGSIIKSNGGHFQRVSSIASNTSLELDRQWGWATETGVAAKVVPANARNRIINCTFNGTTTNSDNVGLGLFDDGLIQGNTSKSADDGYGFGPDHTNRAKFIGNTCYSNGNAGIGMETCGYCVVSGNVCYDNVGGGIYLLSGSYRNTIANNESRNNDSGINISYQNTSFPPPDENSLTGNTCEFNNVHGIRVGGAKRTIVSNNRCANNDQNGIVTVTDNSRVPDLTQIVGNNCYDSQDTKTQDRGIYVLNGTNTLVDGNISLTADHNTDGITDSGTGTVLGDNVE